jgi:hypothetical protein
MTFGSSSPLSPATESGLVLGVVPDQTKQPGSDDKGCGSGEDRDAQLIAIRRECLDQMIVFGEAHLRRVLTSMRPNIMNGEFIDL